MEKCLGSTTHFSIPGGGHVQSSLQTRRQNSDVRHCQRAPLPDTNNTTLFSTFTSYKYFLRGRRIRIKILTRYIVNSADRGEEEKDDSRQIWNIERRNIDNSILIWIWYIINIQGLFQVKLTHIINQIYNALLKHFAQNKSPYLSSCCCDWLGPSPGSYCSSVLPFVADLLQRAHLLLASTYFILVWKFLTTFYIYTSSMKRCWFVKDLFYLMGHHTEKHKLQVLLMPTNFEICFAILNSKEINSLPQSLEIMNGLRGH